ncbi:MAG: tetratricopeptide repeat protein, partial [Thermoanaerobaculia bacterium]|nr:tetratricopeptide repeat protein [Thermoanaerobaculia bacterium]
RGVFVSAQGLTNAVWARRRALCDGARAPRFLETIPRRGYRLIAPVEPASPGAAAEEPPARTIAVLPFADMSRERDQDYLCDGMAEELIHTLARVPELRVVARTSAFQFKGRAADVRRIGDELGADVVLEGSIRKEGRRLRVTAQLISAQDGFHLLSEQFDRQMDDVLVIQEEIAHSVVTTLAATLGILPEAARGRPQPRSVAAYELYLKGLQRAASRYEDDLWAAIALFEQAAEEDPEYPLPTAGLADAYSFLGHYAYLPPKSAFPRARAAAERALGLDDSSPEAHAALGLVLFSFDRDWEAGEAVLRRAIELSPDSVTPLHWYSVLCSYQGRHDEAVELDRRALSRDPLSPYAHALAACNLHRAGRPREALAAGARALEIDRRSPLAILAIALALAETGALDESLATLQPLLAASGRAPTFLPWLALVLARAGRADEAAAVAAELEQRARSEYVSPLFHAAAELAAGRSEAARAWFERAADERDPYLLCIGVEPLAAAARDQPWFPELARRVGLGAFAVL